MGLRIQRFGCGLFYGWCRHSTFSTLWVLLLCHFLNTFLPPFCHVTTAFVPPFRPLSATFLEKFCHLFCGTFSLIERPQLDGSGGTACHGHLLTRVQHAALNSRTQAAQTLGWWQKGRKAERKNGRKEEWEKGRKEELENGKVEGCHDVILAGRQKGSKAEWQV